MNEEKIESIKDGTHPLLDTTKKRERILGPMRIGNTITVTPQLILALELRRHEKITRREVVIDMLEKIADNALTSLLLEASAAWEEHQATERVRALKEEAEEHRAALERIEKELGRGEEDDDAAED